MQLTADIFGLPVSRPHLYEASGLGAAINAAVGAGIHSDYPSALKNMSHIGDTFLPDMKVHRVYRELYEDVYLRMYERLKPFYETMHEMALPKKEHPLMII